MSTNADDDLSLTSGLDDADFRAAFEEMKGGGESKDDAAQEASSTEEVKADEVETPVETAEETETTEAAAEDSEIEETADEQEETVEAAGEDDKSDDAAQDDPEPLDHWNADQKEIFAGLDGKGKELVLKRHQLLEKSYDKKFKDLARQREEANEGLQQVRDYERAVKPYESLLASAGTTPGGAAGQIMALWQGLNDDPAGGMAKIAHEFVGKRGETGSSLASEVVRQVAKQLRVDLDGLDDVDAQADDPAPVRDETITQLQRELNDLRNQLDSTTRADQSMKAAQGQRLWERFRDDPANAHAERLEGEILDHLESRQGQSIIDPAERLQWAYDRAVMVDPTANKERLEAERAKLREEWKAEQEAARLKQSAAVRKVSTQKAKAASTAPKPSAPVTKVPTDGEGESWEQAFRADFNEKFGDTAARV